MIRLGDFFFQYRRLLFPFGYALMLFEGTWPCVRDESLETIMILAGFVIAAGGQTLRAITVGLAYIKRGGKDKKVYADALVTEGMFAHCRNPLYVGNILIVTGVGLSSNSLLFVLIGIPFFLLAYRAIVATEENYLHARFGAEYEEYCRRVSRFAITWRGFGNTWRSMDFHWRRLIIKEYPTPFIWLTGFALLLMKRSYLHFGYEAGRPTLWALCFMCLVLATAYLLTRYLKKSKTIQAD